MKRFVMITALCAFMVCGGAAYARDYILVLSPVHMPAVNAALKKDVLRFLMTGVKPGEKATLIDGWNRKSLAEFTVSDNPKHNHPKIKARQNAAAMRVLQSFGDEMPRSRLQGGVQLPLLYRYLGENFGPFTDTRIIMLASPLYQDTRTPDYSMIMNIYPGDGHLNVPAGQSPFSVVGREEMLSGAIIHWGHPYTWEWNDMYRLRVTRFQHLFAEGYGAKIATFTEDMASLWRRVGEDAKPAPHNFTREDTQKLEMIEIVKPVVVKEQVSIYEWIGYPFTDSPYTREVT